MESFSTGMSSIARFPSAKATSFFPRPASINPKTHSAGRVILLLFHDLLLFETSGSEGLGGSCIVMHRTGEKAFTEMTAQQNGAIAPEGIVT